MAFGKNSIMDSRRPSSSPWSTLTTFLFICICLLGVWMISTTVVPVDVPSTENNLEIKHKVFETNLGNGEGSWRNVPDESLRRYSNDNANNFPPETKPESSENQNVPDKTDESTVEKAQNGDMNDGNSSQTTFSDEDGTTGEGGEVIKEGSGERKEDGKENDQEIVDEISQETTDREQEKKAETFSDENGNTEGAEMSKEGDVSKVGGDENIQEKSTDESSQETTEKNSDDAGDGNDKTQGLEEISQQTTEKSSDDAGDGNGKTEGGEESSQEITEKSSDDAGDGNGKTQGREESSQEITEKSSDDGVDGNSKTQGGEESSQEITEKSSDDAVDGNDKTQGGEETFEETTDSSDDVGDGNGKTQGREESSQETTEKSSDDASDGNGKTPGEEVNSQETTEDSSNDASDGNAKTQGGEESSLETTEKSSDDSSDENVKTQGGEVGSQETKYSDQEKKGDRKNNETTGDEQDKSSDQQNPDDSMVKPEQKLDENAVMGNQTNDQVYDEVLPDAAQSELLNETNTQNGAWSTQATESKNEKEVQAASKDIRTHNWKLCNVSTGVDYIPCLDNVEAIKKLTTTKHYEHRERHCPDEGPTCLVPNPEGYRKSIEWPNSRNKIWYYNVPHSQLASVKGRQNWVRVSGEYLTFPGGGTQFKHGALHYIDFIQQSVPDIAWGKKSRVALDVGCGVASFGGYLFNRDMLTMSFAPKDEHEAQVQLALERGIPAISAVMGTIRLPFPGMVFDVIHCARCKVPWHIEGGVLLLELNRLLRPGGYFIWSATPTYQRLSRDVEIWRAMGKLTKSMCWEMVNKTKDRLNKVGMAIYRKPTNNECYVKRTESAPPLCEDSDDPNAAWNISLQACMHRLPEDPAVRGSKWPQMWPQRLTATPYWLNSSQVGVYGKPAPEDFKVDFKHWKRVVSNSYLNGMGIKWSSVRNIMDMRAIYGGFAAALQEAKKVNAWVMNVVSIDAPDTLRVIYERGLFGIYHNWCESFSTYPRSYDLLHADHLFSKLKQRCKLLPVMAEVDRILRPNGYFILRDDAETLEEVESMARSLNYKIIITFFKENEGLLCVKKTMWRPKEIESSLPTNAKLSN